MVNTELNDLFRFISPKEVKVYCGFSKNVRDDKILPQIQIAQNLYLKKALGDTLYSNLKEDFTNANYNVNNMSDGTTNADGINYKELYYKSFDMLVWWTGYYSLNVVAIQIEEKGLMSNYSEYADNAYETSFKLKEDRIRKIAEEYTENLYCYLSETFKNDEEFNEESVDEGRRFSGIFYPNKTGKNCNKC